MPEAVRHYLDEDHLFTGHEGLWTICGEPWAAAPAGAVTYCKACVDAVIAYADTMRQGQR